MMKNILLIAVLVNCLSAFTIYQSKADQVSAINWPFTICGVGKWTIEKLTMATQPARNANNDIDTLGTANEDTSFTTVDINVKLNGVFLHSQTVQFKKSYQEGDTVEFKYQTFVPSFAPPGTYSLTFTFKKNTQQNGCMGMSFKL